MFDRPVLCEESPRVLATAIALWGALVAAAAYAGAVAKLSVTELAVLAAFIFVFATATYYLDRRVRGLVDSLDLRVLAAFALVADLAIAAGAGFGAIAAVLFVVPLAGAAHMILADRLIRARAWNIVKRVRAGGMPSAAA
jgi:hypothetical protein